MSALRVVSLVPSVTETLLAWGVTPVGVTRFCEQPSLRAVGGTKDPDVDAIVALSPDLVIVNVEENRREDADALVERGVVLHVVGQIAAVEDVGRELASLRAALALPALPDDPLPPHAPAIHRTAFVPIWRRPWMTMADGTYGTAVLAWLGIGNVFSGDGALYPEVTLDGARERRPDLVIAPSEPYPFAERHRAELESVAPVVLVDGRDLFWWGSRTPAALRRLAVALT